MTKTLKWLGGGVAAVMLLGLAGLFSGEVAEAQPSGPPHRFAGSVTIDDEPAAAGTSVTAVVNGAECGSATVIESSAGSTYALDVPDSCADAGDTVSFQVGGYDAAESGTWAVGGRTDLALTASSMSMDDPMIECPDDMAGDGMGDGEGDAPAEPDEPSEPSEPAEPSMNGDDMGDGTDEDCPDPDDMDDPMTEPTEPTEPGTEEPTEPTDPETDKDMDDDMDDMAPEAGDTGTGLATTSTSTSLAAILGVTALAILLGSYTFARRRR